MLGETQLDCRDGPSTFGSSEIGLRLCHLAIGYASGISTRDFVHGVLHLNRRNAADDENRIALRWA